MQRRAFTHSSLSFSLLLFFISLLAYIHNYLIPLATHNRLLDINNHHGSSTTQRLHYRRRWADRFPYRRASSNIRPVQEVHRFRIRLDSSPYIRQGQRASKARCSDRASQARKSQRGHPDFEGHEMRHYLLDPPYPRRQVRYHTRDDHSCETVRHSPERALHQLSRVRPRRERQAA